MMTDHEEVESWLLLPQNSQLLSCIGVAVQCLINIEFFFHEFSSVTDPKFMFSVLVCGQMKSYLGVIIWSV
jgi:hypothetical protein